MPDVDIHPNKGTVSIGGNVAGRDLVDIVVNHYFTATQAAARPEARQRLRVLVVAPDPLGQPLSPLSIAAEWAAFVALVRRFNHPIAVVRLNPPTFTNLQAAVADRAHPFDIIHLIAHGDGKRLALEARDGTLEVQTYSKIAEALKLSPAQLIVLNVCQSLPLAELLSAATIAAAGNVPDLASVAFAENLYAGLFGRQPIAEALKMGERAMERAGVYALRGDGEATLARLADLSNDLGPIIFPGDPPHNAWLPGYSAEGFKGREEQLREDFFPFFTGGDTAALFLTGIGGIGKTTLATAAARRYGWPFTGGVVSVSAKDVSRFGVSNIVSAIDAALGTEAGKQLDSVSAALGILNAGPCLLLLDNLETIDSPEARRDLAQFVARLEAGSGTRAVLTMRPRVLPEFSSVRHRELRVGPLQRAEAIAVLKDRAQPAGRKRLAGHEAEVAEAAYYHPALLTIAAGWMHLAPLDTVLGWLRDLKGDALDEEIPARLGAMIADVEKAAPGAARLLCTLAVFSGGATREAVEAVTPSKDSLPLSGNSRSAPSEASGYPTGEGAGMGVGITLTELVKGNLAELDAADRYDLQSLVAQWARRRGPYTPDEWRAAGRKHAEYFIAFAQKHEQEYRVLEPELENLRDAFAFLTAEATRDDKLTRALVGAMDFFLDKRGYWDEGLRWWQAYGEASERRGDRAGLATTYNNIAAIHYARGDYDAALEWLEKSLAIKQELGDRAGLATTYNNIGMIHNVRGDYTAALEWYEKSLAIRDELGDRAGLATTYNNIAGIHYARGDYDAALEWFEKSVAISDELGDRAKLAGAYNNIGMIHKARGDYAAALQWYEKSVAINEELGDRAMLATTYNNIAGIHYARGDYDAALEWLEKSVAISDELGDRAMLATTYNNIGMIHDDRGDYAAALEWYEKSVAIDEELGNRAGLAESYNNIGMIHDTRGDYATAAEWLEKSLAILEEIGAAAKAAAVRGNLEGVRERMASSG